MNQPTFLKQQNIEGLTGDLCIINYQDRFFKELYRTNVLHIKCIYSFIEKLLEYQHHSRRSYCSIEKQCEVIKIIGFAYKYSMSNEGKKELFKNYLQYLHQIWCRRCNARHIKWYWKQCVQWHEPLQLWNNSIALVWGFECWRDWYNNGSPWFTYAKSNWTYDSMVSVIF